MWSRRPTATCPASTITGRPCRSATALMPWTTFPCRLCQSKPPLAGDHEVAAGDLVLEVSGPAAPPGSPARGGRRGASGRTRGPRRHLRPVRPRGCDRRAAGRRRGRGGAGIPPAARPAVDPPPSAGRIRGRPHALPAGGCPRRWRSPAPPRSATGAGTVRSTSASWSRASPPAASRPVASCPDRSVAVAPSPASIPAPPSVTSVPPSPITIRPAPRSSAARRSDATPRLLAVAGVPLRSAGRPRPPGPTRCTPCAGAAPATSTWPAAGPPHGPCVGHVDQFARRSRWPGPPQSPDPRPTREGGPGHPPARSGASPRLWPAPRRGPSWTR